LTFYTKGKEQRIALMRDRFVPVILDGYLRGTGAEREFLKSAGLVGNGFTYLTAGGKKLGGDSYLGANGLEAALADFDKLPEAERRPRVERSADPGDRKGVPMAPPPGCLIANVYFTYLEAVPEGPEGGDAAGAKWRRALWHVEGQPGAEPGSGHGRNQVLTHVDKLWLTEEEWRSLIPSKPVPGQSHPLPRAIHDRIVRFYANDMAHRSTGDKVRSAELFLTVERASAEAVELRLEGATATGCAFEAAPLGGRESEAPGLCGAEFRFLGRLRYDARKDAFDRFDIVALGAGWGGGRDQAATTNFYRGGEHRRWPMGIAFKLVTTRRPIDRIPPQNANEYRCGDAYFGKEATERLKRAGLER
jgi:hypothetical protein